MMTNAESLAEAVRDGVSTLEAALEEHLDVEHNVSEEDAVRLLAYSNMGWGARAVGPDGGARTVDEFVRLLDLKAFLPLLDDQTDSEYPLGSLVSYGTDAAQVIGRRAASPFVTPRYDDWELFIKMLEGGRVGFVGESEVESVDVDGTAGE